MATPGQDRVERRLAGIVKTTGGGALVEFRRSSDRDAHSIAQMSPPSIYQLCLNAEEPRRYRHR